MDSGVNAAIDVTALSFSDIMVSFNQPVDPVSSETLTLLYKIFNAVVLALCFTGTCTNIITLRAFHRMGLDDSITISFFSLAVCDLANCVILSAAIICDICNILDNEGVIDVDTALYIPYFYIFGSRMVFSLTTAVIKDFMAIQRCLCVALPFRVRGLFTRFRTFVFLGISVCITSLWTVVFVSGHMVQTVSIPFYNVTYPIIARVAEMEIFVEHQEFAITVVFSTINQAICLICLMIMVIALKKSVRFRTSATAKVLGDSSKKDKASDTIHNSAEKSNSKEKQVLIQVTLLTTLFFVTAVPMVGQGIATITVPGYFYNNVYHNLYMTILGVGTIAEVANAAGNFFVYLKYNSKFRKHLFYSHTNQKG